MKDAFLDEPTFVDATEEVSSADLGEDTTSVTKAGAAAARRPLIIEPPTEAGGPPSDEETTIARRPEKAPLPASPWVSTRMGAGDPPPRATAALVIEEEAAARAKPESSNSDSPAPKPRGARFLSPVDATKKLDRYELLAEIAAGGMATVFLARLRGAGGFQRLVAIKRLHPHLANEEDFIQMFLDEARIAAQIHHAHVVPILEIGSSETEGYYLVMEYIEGVTLFDVAQAAAQKKLPLPRGVALRVVLDTLSGLHAAHELCDANGHHLSVVHRDCSPSNLLVGIDGSTRLTDFGVARAASRLSTTVAGTLKGKVAYMAPEQIQHNEYDRRADLFAMGVVLWELFTGQRLFRAENKTETLKRVLNAPIPRLGELVYGISTPLDAAVARALARDPTQRFQTATEMAEVLEKAAGVTIASPRHVAEFVQKLFGAEIAERRDSIRKWTDAAEAERALAPMDRLRRASRPPMPTAAELARAVAERRASQPPPARISALPVDAAEPKRTEQTVAAKRSSVPDPIEAAPRKLPPRPSSSAPPPAPRASETNQEPPPPPSVRPEERVQVARIIAIEVPSAPEPQAEPVAPRVSRPPVLEIVDTDSDASSQSRPEPRMPEHKVSLSAAVVASIEEHVQNELRAAEEPPPSAAMPALGMRKLEPYSIQDETVLRPRKPPPELIEIKRPNTGSLSGAMWIIAVAVGLATLLLFGWLRYRVQEEPVPMRSHVER